MKIFNFLVCCHIALPETGVKTNQATRPDSLVALIGGGGGTAVPVLSNRAGLYLHPVSQDAGRVIHL